MVEIERALAEKIKNLFGYTNETFALSFLQNHMGRGWADNRDNPTCAQIIVGDFCLLAGDSESPYAIRLVKNIPQEFEAKSCLLMVPQNDAWGALIEESYIGKYNKITRYAIKKEGNCFDIERLQNFICRLPSEFRITQIDEPIYHKTFQNDFSKDWCSQFDSAKDFIQRGLGYCILHGNEIVCGASSYTIYSGGIEIQVDTKEEYKHQGLATACAAKLILECLHRNLYPSWDAHDRISVALAEKLGYHLDFEYIAYEVYCDISVHGGEQ